MYRKIYYRLPAEPSRPLGLGLGNELWNSGNLGDRLCLTESQSSFWSHSQTWPRFQSNGQSVRSPPLCPNCCGNLHGSQCRGPSSPFRLTEESESQLHAGYLAPSLKVAGQSMGDLARGGHRKLRTASSSWNWALLEVRRLGAR